MKLPFGIRRKFLNGLRRLWKEQKIKTSANVKSVELTSPMEGSNTCRTQHAVYNVWDENNTFFIYLSVKKSYILEKLMKNIIFTALVLVFFWGCDINETTNTDAFVPIDKTTIESLFNQSFSIDYSYIIGNDIVSDTLNSSLGYNLYPLEIRFNETNDSLIVDTLLNGEQIAVFSQQQAYIDYQVDIDSSTILLDTLYLLEFEVDSTFMVISESDTTFIDSSYTDTLEFEVDQEFIDSVYNELNISFIENENIVINNFDLSKEKQKDSFDYFKGPVAFNKLYFLPDSTFKPKNRFFRITGTSVIYGGYSSQVRTQNFNLMQDMIFESLEGYFE